MEWQLTNQPLILGKALEIHLAQPKFKRSDNAPTLEISCLGPIHPILKGCRKIHCQSRLFPHMVLLHLEDN